MRQSVRERVVAIWQTAKWVPRLATTLIVWP
jgi:hypothetical protein